MHVDFYQSTQKNTYVGGFKQGEIEVKMSIVAGIWEGEWGIARGEIVYEGPIQVDTDVNMEVATNEG